VADERSQLGAPAVLPKLRDIIRHSHTLVIFKSIGHGNQPSFTAILQNTPKCICYEYFRADFGSIVSVITVHSLSAEEARQIDRRLMLSVDVTRASGKDFRARLAIIAQEGDGHYPG
jgi:hypothetical protein